MKRSTFQAIPASTLLGLFCLFNLFFLNSCSSGAVRTTLFENIEKQIQQRDFSAAVNSIEAGKDRYYSARDRVLYYLDIGMLYHYQGDYQKSNEFLTQAEYAIEELFTRSISRAASSLLLNDNILEYPGEDYEDIYINIIKAVNFLNMEQFDNAFVEIRRINDKLNLLEDKYKDLAESYQTSEDAQIEFKTGTSNFHNSVLGRYLSLLIYRSEGRLDSAQIDFNAIKDGWRSQSQIYNFPQPELTSHLNIGDKAKVNFICFVGKPPIKKPFERRITTYNGYMMISGNEPVAFSDLIYWPGMTKDFHFKFSLPFMQTRESRVHRVRVLVNNRPVGNLELIEDVGNIARETFAVKAPVIYFRSVVRSVVKGIAAERAKTEMRSRTSPLLGAVMSIATDVAVDVSEQADIRASRFLPGRTLIGEIELEPGVYDVSVEYYDSYGNLIFRDNHPGKEIHSKGLNLVNTFYLN